MMTPFHQARGFRLHARTRAGAALGAALIACALLASPAGADDLPPPQVRRGAKVPVRPRAPTRALPRTARPSGSVAAVALRPGAVTGRPSEPVTARGRRDHSTYVPPLGGTTARRPRGAGVVRATPARPPAAAPRSPAGSPRPRAGRVPVTTFRVAPAPRPRVTTWSPRRVPVAPARGSALPAARVTKASPSYADLERTRAQTVTARSRPTVQPRRRTLQRRASDATPRRRAVRAKDLAVPMAPGQCAPRAPVRRTLPLVPPPGCEDGG